jgi:hypothetical protein
MARLRRHAKPHTKRRRSHRIGIGNKAGIEGRSIFAYRVTPVLGSEWVLKSGINSSKIGGWVTKGKWAGMPIFTLTLEERATCPRTCLHWDTCYGNKMPWAPRYAHGQALEIQLDKELYELNKQYQQGFVVRLHVLGDFYSLEYVRFWAGQLATLPNLRVFGYTAWQPSTLIGRELEVYSSVYKERFALRFSNGAPGLFRTVSVNPMPEDGLWVDKLPSVIDGGIVCPAQTGKTECCGTCGLCWTTPKPIAFLQH